MKHLLAQALKLPWEGEGQPNIEGPEGLKFTDLGQLISQPVIQYVFAAAGMGLLLMLVSSGFTFLTSSGDAKKLESGKQRLTYSLVGFIVIFVAYWLVQILGKILGITEIQNTFQ